MNTNPKTAAISSALERAGRAIAGDGDYMKDCVLFDKHARSAVAAFLRALPGVIVFEWLKEGRSVGMGTAADLANRVDAVKNGR